MGRGDFDASDIKHVNGILGYIISRNIPVIRYVMIE